MITTKETAAAAVSRKADESSYWLRASKCESNLGTFP
jgi:hypothetical protein